MCWGNNLASLCNVRKSLYVYVCVCVIESVRNFERTCCGVISNELDAALQWRHPQDAGWHQHWSNRGFLITETAATSSYLAQVLHTVLASDQRLITCTNPLPPSSLSPVQTIVENHNLSHKMCVTTPGASEAKGVEISWNLNYLLSAWWRHSKDTSCHSVNLNFIMHWFSFRKAAFGFVPA